MRPFLSEEEREFYRLRQELVQGGTRTSEPSTASSYLLMLLWFSVIFAEFNRENHIADHIHFVRVSRLFSLSPAVGRDDVMMMLR